MADSLLQIILPKKRGNPAGATYTDTFNPASQAGVITAPLYRDHLTDLFDSRTLYDSRALIKDLSKFDPDVSAAYNSYLTMANTEPVIVVRDLNEAIDRVATQQVYQVIRRLTHRWDYTQGFQLKRPLATLCEEMRSMILLRGAIGAEAVVDKTSQPSEIRLVDTVTLEWLEAAPGQYKPRQRPSSTSTLIDLDLGNFFVAMYRRDPTGIYTYSPFVSAINTIAARAQVINDLYRIMRLTGYPRIDLSVAEEVVTNSAPANVKADQGLLRTYLNDRIKEISASFTGIRSDQAFVHTDAVQSKILNEKGSGVALDISSVINTLNSQNQAGLKTMATVIGRGDSGVNTASVEARIAAMNSDELNGPVASILSDVLTFYMNLTGYQGFVDVKFRNVEMRPDLELEPQKIMQQSRLQNDLSLGLITDDDYHLQMYGRIRPDSAPELSGTGFMAPQPAAMVDPTNISPNSDPLGRSLTPPGSKSAKSNTVKKPKK